MSDHNTFAVSEIVATIEAFGDELRGDPDGIAKILDAICAAIGPRREQSSPDYQAYEESELGRCFARSEQAANEAWNWLISQLEAISTTCRRSAEFYI